MKKSFTLCSQYTRISRWGGVLLLSLGAANVLAISPAALSSAKISMPLATPQKTASNTLGSLPLYFEENVGQFPNSIEFIARSNGFNVALDGLETHMWIAEPIKAQNNAASASKLEIQQPFGAISFLPKSSPIDYRKVVMRPLNAKELKTQWKGEDTQVGISNYHQGQQNFNNVRHFGRVTHESVYPGIDLTYYGNPQKLEYDWIVSPNADPNQIALGYEGVSEIKVSKNGDAQLQVGEQILTQHKPIAYQIVEGKRQTVGVSYQVIDTEKGEATGLRFSVASYNRNQPLIIDPVITYYASYFGGLIGDDTIESIKVDQSGNIYVAGYSKSTDFLNLPSAVISEQPFVAKLNPTGDTLLWKTLLQGTANTAKSGFAKSLAIGVDGKVYVGGYTQALNLATAGAYDTSFLDGSGNIDGFIAQLNTDGTIGYLTYIGGEGDGNGDNNSDGLDGIWSIAVNSLGEVYAAGFTSSPNFPISTGLVLKKNDAFVVKLNANGSNLIYSSVIDVDNGSIDLAYDIAIDDLGKAYISGVFHNESNSVFNAFAARLNTVGLAEKFFKFSENGSSNALGIALDNVNNVYLAGYTSSTEFPVTNALSAQFGGGTYDGFVAKLQANDWLPLYVTYQGGSKNDMVLDISVANNGEATITGMANYSPENQVPELVEGNAFVSRYNSTGSAFVFSKELSGQSVDMAYSLAVLGNSIYVGGKTKSIDFITNLAPTLPPYYSNNYIIGDEASMNYDGFIVKLTTSPTDTAVLQNPVGTIVTQTPTYVWQAVEGATQYQLNVTDNNGVSHIQATYSAADSNCATDTSCEVTPTTVVSGINNWTITAINEAGSGQPSAVKSFNVVINTGQTQLINPEGMISTQNPAYRWQAANNASIYSLRVVDSSGFTRVNSLYTPQQVQCSGDTSCEITPSTKVSGANSWSVTTYKTNGTISTTASKSFIAPSTPATPQQISPSLLSFLTTTKPTYRWRPVSGATHYILHVEDILQVKIHVTYTAAEVGCVNAASSTTICQATPDISVTGYNNWSVRAKNEAGILSNQASGLDFFAPLF